MDNHLPNESPFLIEHFFRNEYGKMIAVITRYLGTEQIETAEDIAQEALLKAVENWSHNGIPESPRAWLRKTAKNLFIDQYRRKKKFDKDISPQLIEENQESNDLQLSDEIIEDSQLKMIFVVCDPKLNKEAQLCLALRILSGFSIDEIAKALLSNKETINKKLYRAKKTLRLENGLTSDLSENQYAIRLDNVLRVIYLIFNEGYFSSVNEKNIRQEVCYEAMYLCKFLESKSLFSKSKIQALLALMCFHASRFNARTSDTDMIQLYHEQDKSKWNIELIKKGEAYLNKSATGNIVSKYHLEAAIAFWHTTADETKWNNILQLYNKLLIIEYSPIIAMNRTYALAKANSVKEAIESALKLGLKDNHYYYCLLAELYKLNNDNIKEIQYLEKALKMINKSSEKDLIERKLKNAKRR